MQRTSLRKCCNGFGAVNNPSIVPFPLASDVYDHDAGRLTSNQLL